jgi:hypothetical protein
MRGHPAGVVPASRAGSAQRAWVRRTVHVAHHGVRWHGQEARKTVQVDGALARSRNHSAGAPRRRRRRRGAGNPSATNAQPLRAGPRSSPGLATCLQSDMCLDDRTWPETITSPPYHRRGRKHRTRPSMPALRTWIAASDVLRGRPGAHGRYHLWLMVSRQRIVGTGMTAGEKGLVRGGRGDAACAKPQGVEADRYLQGDPAGSIARGFWRRKRGRHTAPARPLRRLPAVAPASQGRACVRAAEEHPRRVWQEGRGREPGEDQPDAQDSVAAWSPPLPVVHRRQHLTDHRPPATPPPLPETRARL